MKAKIIKYPKGVMDLTITRLTEGEYLIIKNAIALYGGPVSELIKKALEAAESKTNDGPGVFRRVKD